LIRYSYRDCRYGVLNFGSFSGSDAFTPHNVILDVYNDAGWIPTLCILLAILPITVALLRGFWIRFVTTEWDWQLAVRWSFFSVLLVEWVVQPLLYTDQLMFSIGFVLVGLLLADFSPFLPDK